MTPQGANGGDWHGVAAWLTDGARSASESSDVLNEMCERLVGCGVRLWRAAVFVRTLHPDVMGRRFLWRAGEGTGVSEAPFDVLDRDEFKNSPFARVCATGAPIRVRLDTPGAAENDSILRDLRAEGGTDYLASPLSFTNGEIHVATWTSREPGGFTPAEIAALEGIAAPLARVAEIRALRRTAVNFLNTYVGSHAGERILAGRIRRGHTETIDAAIWLSDMRGFTALADRLPPQDLIALLNRYFDCQVPAILERGGEVLKFMGDGLLAIFPIGRAGKDRAAVCGDAIAAARAARERLRAAVGAPGSDQLRFGLALHVGEVLYGNIGGATRLDFTCIGPAINLAARLEKLAGSLGRSIVASAEFARHCDAGLVRIGEHALAGFSAAQTVYGLEDEG